MTTVLLVDDVDELRTVVRHALRLRGGFDVVAEAADGTSAIAAAARTNPDIVVLDLGLPDLAGRAVLSGLREAAPDSRIVIYSGTHTADRLELAASVDAYLGKESDVRRLVELLTSLREQPRPLASLELGSELVEVSRARHFVAERCDRWSCPELSDAAQVVVSELVTNALVHARSGCELSARLVGDRLRLEVVDRGGGVPDLHAPDTLDEHGRGLLLVTALASAWGSDQPTSGTKRVWAELDRTGRSGRAQAV